MVLDAGKIAEFDSPETLISNPDSVFRAMVSNSRKRACSIYAVIPIDSSYSMFLGCLCGASYRWGGDQEIKSRYVYG